MVINCIHPDDRKAVDEQVAKAFSEGSAYEMCIRDSPEHVVIFFDLLMVQIPDDLLQPKVGLVDASVEDRIITCPQRNLRQNNEQAQIPAFYHAGHQNRRGNHQKQVDEHSCQDDFLYLLR